MMHNFCTVFLVTEILLTSPQLEFVYMLFGILIGLAYALFAFPFAAFGGGFYVYSFIDPRLQKAPLFITMLALAISLSYVGVWFVSELISFNIFIGGSLLVAWCSQIVQFKPLNAWFRGGRSSPGLSLLEPDKVSVLSSYDTETEGFFRRTNSIVPAICSPEWCNPISALGGWILFN